MPHAINLTDKLAQIKRHWHPHVVGELNGQHVKLAKIKGAFDWHHHDDADELFLVLNGQFEMHLEDRVVPLAEGDLFIVPRGVVHRPVADEEAHILLFEPVGTRNTGNRVTERTVTDLPYL